MSLGGKLGNSSKLRVRYMLPMLGGLQVTVLYAGMVRFDIKLKEDKK
jgi:hypothetical protein